MAKKAAAKPTETKAPKAKAEGKPKIEAQGKGGSTKAAKNK